MVLMCGGVAVAGVAVAAVVDVAVWWCVLRCVGASCCVVVW